MEEYLFEAGFTVGVTIASMIMRWVIQRSVAAYAKKHGLAETRVIYIDKTFGIILTVIWLVTLGFIWEISVRGLSIYFASFFTIAGIGLFATWSILSNITAAVILFFYFPHKIGAKVKILDGDNSVTGVIKDITLFSLQITTEEGATVIFPNNAVIQKTTVILE